MSKGQEHDLPFEGSEWLEGSLHLEPVNCIPRVRCERDVGNWYSLVVSEIIKY